MSNGMVLKQPTGRTDQSFSYYHSKACMPESMIPHAVEIPHTDLVDDCVCSGCGGNIHQTAQKYPDGSIVLMNGYEWTVELLCRDGENLLPGQVDRGEDYNLYRLSRHNTKPILRWQYEIDAEMKQQASR
jgi:hypothetical protein